MAYTPGAAVLHVINLHDLSLGAILGIPILLYLCYLLATVLYNAFFHPLSKFPGPFWWGATPIPYVWYQLTGQLPFIYQRLHEQYGDVVRVLPYKLSFCAAAAWKDIYQIRPKQPLMTKDFRSLKPGPEGVYNIITSFDPAEHARYRGKLNPAFSARALQEQEPIVMRHVDHLIKKLSACCAEGPQDMVKWPSMVYFDIVADLIFGRELGNVENGEPQSWLNGLFGSTMAMITLHRGIGQFTHISKYAKKLLTPKWMVDQQVKHAEFVRTSVEQRMADEKKDGKDFMSYILPYDEEVVRMSMPEVRATYGTLMIAGSENVSTSLTFTIYHLLKDRDTYKKLAAEVRRAFPSDNDITFTSTMSLKPLSAVINEAMRLNPAAPTSQPRIVPKGGASIAGHSVPGGAVVAAPPYCMNHSSQFFKDPNSYHPDRWLDTDPHFAGDNKRVFNPFQLGPRACAGKTMALGEIHVVLAKMLWTFDLELDERCQEWDKGMKIYHLWQLKPLWVKLTPVRKNE